MAEKLLRILLPAAIIALCLWMFLGGLRNLDEGRAAAGKEQLESAVRRAAVACYAAEGIYPPDLAYLTEHYGIQIDGERYVVYYSIFADNLMPDITVLEVTS